MPSLRAKLFDRIGLDCPAILAWVRNDVGIFGQAVVVTTATGTAGRSHA